MMNNTFRVVSLIVAGCFLTACEPMMFDMPASQFQSLSPSQQQEVISGYNQRQLVQTENQPAEDLIGVAGTLASGLQQQNNVAKAPSFVAKPSPPQPAPSLPQQHLPDIHPVAKPSPLQLAPSLPQQPLPDIHPVAKPSPLQPAPSLPQQPLPDIHPVAKPSPLQPAPSLPQQHLPQFHPMAKQIPNFAPDECKNSGFNINCHH